MRIPFNMLWFAILYIVSMTLVSSCTLDDGMSAENDNRSDFEKDKIGVCTSTGVPARIPFLDSEQQLLSIERMEPSKTVKDTFIYDLSDRLVSIEELEQNGFIHYFNYSNDTLIEIVSYDKFPELKFFGRDSFSFNLEGQLKNVHYFRTENTLARIDSFFYFDQGHLKYQSTINSSGTYSSHEVYCWENGNLLNWRAYNRDGELTSEWVYTYSDEKEVKPEHLNPLEWKWLDNWSLNKLTDSKFFDYVGNVDFTCNPCYTDFTYDDEGRLIFGQGYGRSIEYTYRN